MNYVVYLDDGHGMETAGKRTPAIPSLSNRVIRENEFNRAVVNKMKPMLERSGIKVVLSAPTDKDTPLAERVRVINNDYNAKVKQYGKSNVKAIVCSIHYNAYDGKFDGESKDPSGISVFHHTGSTAGNKLAKDVYAELVKGTEQKERGVKDANFYILKYTTPPAILTENGFMDNLREALLMLDPDFINEVALETVVGICKNMGVKYVPEPPKPAPVKPVVDTNTEILPEGTVIRVITGSYRDRANAVAQQERLKKLGIDSFLSIYKV